MNCAGFSLIEVMISLLLLSLGLLGLSAMEVYANNEIQQIYFFNQALNQLNNLTECLSHLTPTTDMHDQIQRWNQENRIALPHGLGDVTGKFPEYRATIYWGRAQKKCVHHHLGASGCLQKIIYLG